MNATPNPEQQLWQLIPRDPIVLGDGRLGQGFGSANTWPFPQPGTLAGMVRTTLLRGHSDVTPTQAARLLHVHVRGPWMLGPESAVNKTESSRLHFPAPSDVLLDPDPPQNGESKEQQLVGGTLERLPAASVPGTLSEAGVLWPKPQLVELSSQLPLPRSVVTLSERNEESGQKRARLQNALWPMDLLVHWCLNLRPTPSALNRSEPGSIERSTLQENFNTLARRCVASQTPSPLHREDRVHVSLKNETGTADPGMLFSSSGLRFAEGWRLGLEVTYPQPEEGDQPSLPTGDHLALLGGEGRPSYLKVSALGGKPAGRFPDFDDHRPAYKLMAGQASGLRLQLLTPAYLPVREKNGGRYHEEGDPGWCPSWLLKSPRNEPHHHPALKALLQAHRVRLSLEALCLSGHEVVSGWNLQARKPKNKHAPDARIFQATGAPREVRRLVPAGTVYYLGLEAAEGGASPLDASTQSALLFKLCEALWGGTLDPDGPAETDFAGQLEDFRAPASTDGYGLVLPGYW